MLKDRHTGIKAAEDGIHKGVENEAVQSRKSAPRLMNPILIHGALTRSLTGASPNVLLCKSWALTSALSRASRWVQRTYRPTRVPFNVSCSACEISTFLNAFMSSSIKRDCVP